MAVIGDFMANNIDEQAAGVLLGPGVVVHGHQKDRDTEAVDASRGREDHLPTQHCHDAPTTPPVSKPWRTRLHHATI